MIKIILILIYILININPVYASSASYELISTIDSRIQNDSVKVTVGFEGNKTMALSQDLLYDPNYLEITNLESIEPFNTIKGNITNENNLNKITLEADSDYEFISRKYVTITFKIKDKFEINKSTNIIINNTKLVGSDFKEIDGKSKILTLNRTSFNTINLTNADYNIINIILFYIKSNIKIILIIIISIVVLIILINIIKIIIKNIKIKKKKRIQEQKKLDEIEDKKQLSHVNNLLENQDYMYEEDDIYTGPDTYYMNNSNNNLNNNVNEDTKEINENKKVNAFDMKLPNPNNNQSSDNNIETLPIILFIILLLISFTSVKAKINSEINSFTNIDESEKIDALNHLRKEIVGLEEWNAKYDYSEDGKISIIDIIYIKDLTNITYKE